MMLTVLLAILYLEGFIFWAIAGHLASKLGKVISLPIKVIIAAFWPLVTPILLFIIYTTINKTLENVSSTLQLISNLQESGGFCLESSDEASSDV